MDIVDRFIGYTKINTTTNRENGANGIMPSSPNQMELAKLIKKELEDLGIKDISLSEKAILIAKLPSNLDKKVPSVAFFAHLDTSAEQTNDTKAQIVKYEGGDICLNEELEIYLKKSEFKELENYIGDDIIVTDGTSLLGADDKAAIASIVNMLKYFTENTDVKHGEIVACFVPDEEQGLRGAKALDASKVGTDFGYCLDCCGIGEFIYENWNAGDCVVTFTGASAHPMNAKGKLINSLLMAHKFISLLPNGEAPEYTENKEGYFWVKELSGNSAKTVLKIDVREFDDQKYKKRMQFLQDLADGLNKVWNGKVDIKLNDRYENVYNYLKNDNAPAIVYAKTAFKNLGIKPIIKPMRGGYDGAVISAKGIPCPNIFTGAHNFHSIYEYLPVKSLRAASEVTKEIVKLVAKD
ncbi:peptidase T [Campylobacter blaseri]|uniref:Peptidase T n=1 Tax=Campylobacter blaseri TaxID=2042961 RepID=A0A2P8R3P2_9BACT|nr:peptidase T [Campylobacter blaseri]PSM53117.1 peptidase T [Campylobacter blaseri]PSM54583.1 peptidase T [Campylobacter blaseri]QKF86944.1 peptidase T [Campylobacter blaseri]